MKTVSGWDLEITVDKIKGWPSRKRREEIFKELEELVNRDPEEVVRMCTKAWL